MTQKHRQNLSRALRGNKNGLGKNLGNQNAKGTVGSKNGMWKGGVSSPAYKIFLAGRDKPQICEVCYRKATIDFDHDHNTGLFRGWICRRCNLVLGMVQDNQSLLRSLAKYLDLQSEETRPKVLLDLNVFFTHNSHDEDNGDEQEDTGSAGGNLGE